MSQSPKESDTNLPKEPALSLPKEPALSLPKEPALSLPKGPYDAITTEPEILNYWLENKFFKPEYHPQKGLQTTEEMKKDGRETFSIVNPPPNAYMRPHVGNVSGYAYQDAFLRFNRLLGKKVLGQPGKDHAGIQGEVVVEKIFIENKNKTKQDMGREKFYKASYAHFEKLMPMVMQDEQRIGLSSDYDRNLFTLDPKVVDTVLGTFIKMFGDTMVYKGVRIVNWDPVAQTTLADIDTERVERDTELVYINYPIINQKAWQLSFRDPAVLKRIADGTKTIETRALNPEESNRYFGDIKAGDLIVCVDKTEEIYHEYRIVEKVETFNNLTEAFDRLDWERVLEQKPSSVEDLNTSYNKLSEEYAAKINTNGLVAIHLREIKPEEFIQVATTRAETMLGDTAVIVNPKDKRYEQLVGKNIMLPIVNREIPLITSPRVEMEFGTGAVKLTPAHAYDDYVMQNEWNLENPDKQVPYINIINKQAQLTGPIPANYKGLKTEAARKQIIEDLRNLVAKKEKHTQSVMVGERSKAIIEQIMSSQWFIDVEKLKQPAIKAVKEGAVKIHPQYMTKKYLNWMENLHDWPVSRSLWWGYRIPVWYKGELKETIDENGQIVETIAGQKIDNLEDAVTKGLAKVQIADPDLKGNLVLIPGKYGFMNRKIYPDLLQTYSNASMVDVKNIENPSYQDYLSGMSKVKFKEDTTIVAHSLGTLASMKYLTENKVKIDALIMIAPPAYMREKDKVAPYADMFDDKAIQEVEQYVNKLIIIHSDNDELMTLEQFKSLTDKFKEVEVYIEPGKGHYAALEYNNRSEKLEEILEKHLKTKNDWIQDPDVFDTWFSSGQWPYATIKANELMDTFYPTDVMETAHDILELWVSRMIMLSLYTQDKVPFTDVYLHGIVKAPDGQKMSKSKGNVISPSDIIETYGADSLRLLYIVGNKAGASYPVSYEKLEGYKRFLNKIWNAAKFGLINLSDIEDINKLKDTQMLLSEADKNMLEHISKLVKDTTRRITKFQLGIAAQELHESFWHTFADIYIEEAKSRLYTKDRDGNPINDTGDALKSRRAAQWVIYKTLRTYLIMLHPFVPFITEKIWQSLPKLEGDPETIMYADWESLS